MLGFNIFFIMLCIVIIMLLFSKLDALFVGKVRSRYFGKTREIIGTK